MHEARQAREAAGAAVNQKKREHAHRFGESGKHEKDSTRNVQRIQKARCALMHNQPSGEVSCPNDHKRRRGKHVEWRGGMPSGEVGGKSSHVQIQARTTRCKAIGLC